MEKKEIIKRCPKCSTIYYCTLIDKEYCWHDDTKLELVKDSKPQDTPEEWKEKVNKFFYEDIGRGNNYIDVSYEDMDELVVKAKDFIQSLLDEREREVLEMIYRKQDCFLHLGDFERWLEEEYPELESIDLSDC